MSRLPKKGSTLEEYQVYIKATLEERGFSEENIEQKFLLFTEEVGELAKAIRKHHTNLKTSLHSKDLNVLEEAGDVLILFIDICNKLGISSEEALRYKESINKKRAWK